MIMQPTRRGLMAGITGAAALSAFGGPRLGQAQAQAGAGAAAADPRSVSYLRRVGDAEVVTLLDGYFPLPLPAITGLAPDALARNLGQAFLDPQGPVPLPVAVHLIRQGDRLTLIDAGGGTSLGPTVGRVGAMLANLGIAPERIGRVCISHMHPDHIGGLMNGAAPTFPNATVHVSATELAFWTDQGNAARAPDFLKPWFTLAGAVAAAYRPRITTFQGESDLGAGLVALPMPGHTPGHSGYRLSAGAATLLLWADSTAVASLQFAHLDVGFVFDTDSVLAANTRRRVLDMVATDRLLVAGTHMPFPGFGRVVRREQAYAWSPEEWQLS